MYVLTTLLLSILVKHDQSCKSNLNALYLIKKNTFQCGVIMLSVNSGAAVVCLCTGVYL